MIDTAPLTLSNAFTNTSTGTVALGATAAVTVTGAFTNGGALDVDIGAGDGGGNLTIGGTLANTGTVQMGSDFLMPARPNVTSAPTNASGASFEVFGSAGHPATLAFTGARVYQQQRQF